MSVLTPPDRYLIAIGTKIEPKIFRTQAEAEKAAETLAYRTGKGTATYRLSDAGLVSTWNGAEEYIGVDGIRRFRGYALLPAATPFRPDGSSWLDKPAETAWKPLPETATF